MTQRLTVAACVAGLVSLAALPAEARVVYDPAFEAGDPSSFFTQQYPVAGGYLQPDETLGTSPSYIVGTTPYTYGVRVVERCQYPHGWNTTDFSRDINGIPNGIGHTCPVEPYVVRSPR